MFLVGMSIHYFTQAMQRRQSRFRRSRELEQISTSGSGTQETISEFSTQESSEQWSQESRSSDSTQSHSSRASAQRNERKHQTYQERSKGSNNRLPIIKEEPLDRGYLEVPKAPNSHGCNQTCRGHSPRAGEPRVGLGIAQGKGRFA